MTHDSSTLHGGEHDGSSSRSTKRGTGHGHIRRVIRDALDGLPLERFRRICGLFDAVVLPALKEKDPSRTHIETVAQKFHELREKIDQKLTQKDRVYQADDLGHDAHNLHLLLGALLPVTILDNVLPSLRDDYRLRVPAEVHAGYINSPNYKALDRCDRKLAEDSRLQLLRSDYVYLVNEIRRLTLLEYHIEEARAFLIGKLRWTLFKLAIVPLLIGTLFLISQVLIEYHSPLAAAYVGVNGKFTTLYYTLVMATLLSLAAVVGAIGSFISAFSRIEGVPENSEIGRSVVALRSSESIRLAPVTGFVFAIVMSFIFGGGLVSGSLFPNVGEAVKDYGSWPLVLFVPAELAKWLTWSFIIGFSERLMPDMIDRLVIRADKTFETLPPAAARIGRGINAGPNGITPGGGGNSGRSRKYRRHTGKPKAAASI
jgi:hypothetical protein